MIGKSSCSSVALSSTKRSKTMSSTLCGRAFSRSILLMTTIGLALFSSAFLRTKRVCACGPSCASTTSKNAVDHFHDALDFAAEVGVAGSVDDVDVVTVPFEGGVLGANGDALFAFEIHRIHHALLDLLVGAEGAGLAQQLIDERGLAVIDVGDDGDVADFVHDVHASQRVEQAPPPGGDDVQQPKRLPARSAEYGRDRRQRQPVPGWERGRGELESGETTARNPQCEKQKRQVICMTCRFASST